MKTLRDMLLVLAPGEWVSPEEIGRRLGEADIEYVYQKTMYGQSKCLIISKCATDKKSKRLFQITAQGIADRDLPTDLTKKLARKETKTSGLSGGEANAQRKLASWKAILSGLTVGGWFRCRDIVKAAAGFYGPCGCRKALRQMTEEGLLEVTTAVTHQFRKLYRRTPDGADFCGGM